MKGGSSAPRRHNTLTAGSQDRFVMGKALGQRMLDWRVPLLLKKVFNNTCMWYKFKGYEKVKSERPASFLPTSTPQR